MQTFDLLLAISDRRVGNLIDSLVRNVCGDDAILNCTRVTRIDELTTEAARENFHLIIVSPENLLLPPGRWASEASLLEVGSAFRTIKTLKSTPIVTVGVQPENELALLEAGADQVLGLPFNCDDFKFTVRKLGVIPTQSRASQFQDSPLVAGWKRGWQRLSGALAAGRSSLH